MQRAMEIRGDKAKELTAERALQAKTPDRIQYMHKSHLNPRPKSQQCSQSYSGNGKSNRQVKCFECGSTDHIIRNCPSVICSKCGKKGHMAGSCRSEAHHVEELATELGIALMAVDVSLPHYSHIVVDSGASRPFTGDKSLLNGFKSTDTVSVKIADGSVYQSAGVGTMCIGSVINGCPCELVVPNTYYIKEFQNTLLSAIDLTDRDHTVIMEKDCCRILDSEHVLKAVAKKDNNLFRISHDIWLEAHALKSELVHDVQGLWHRRLGHVNFGTLRDMSCLDVANDFVLPSTSSHPPDCETCIKAKQTCKSLPKESLSHADHALGLVHSDLCGPLPPSLGGGLYFITFMDDHTRYGQVYIIQHKSDALSMFKRYRQEAESITGQKLQVLRSDHGGEFVNHSFNMELEKHGIHRQLTNPRTPEQNGTAEHLNRTLLDMAIAVLSDSGLPKQFWAEAVTTAMYIRNRVLTHSIQGITPYEGWFGTKPSLGHLRVWGCLCYVLHDDSSQGKLDERSRPCALVGYSKESKGYRLFDPSAKAPHQVITSQNVVFLESKCLNMSSSSVSSSSLSSHLVSVDLFSDDMAQAPIIPAVQQFLSQLMPFPVVLLRILLIVPHA